MSLPLQRAEAEHEVAVMPQQAATLNALQKDSFSYFINQANPANGLVLDKSRAEWPASIAAVGLALGVYPIGVECGFIAREQAIERSLNTLRFFDQAPQGKRSNASGYKGFYYHFLRMDTGRRAWKSELSSIDSALLFAGMLTAAAYFQHETAPENEIRMLADKLYRRADWQWMQNGGAAVSHGWTPERGFLPYHWKGYDEALIVYLLGLGSPTHALTPDSYAAWCSTHKWKRKYDIDYLYAGPLFIHQLSHVWVDFRGIRDRFMREHDLDYFENSRRATYVQQQYAIRNPLEFEHYDKHCWGITSSDGPGPTQMVINGIQRVFYDYIARGAPYGPDDGTMAPWAVVASLPFAPEIVLPTIENFERMHLNEPHQYGYKATFNPTYPLGTNEEYGWVSPYHFGLNQGPIVMMIENFRSGYVWQLMRQCPYLVTGLRRAGFNGAWLEDNIANKGAS
ncbi:MAG: glucoamylase family protein [Burkholderiaceae bacterium]